MIYLNNAGTSYPKPLEVQRVLSEAASAAPEASTELYERAHRSALAEFLPGGRLIFTSGCTSALALSLGDLPFQPDDVLVTSSLEHHALDRVAQSLELQRGVQREALGYRPGQPVDLDQLETLLVSGRVRAVAVTAASNITGEHLPLREMSQLCKKADVLFLVDAAQSFGTASFVEAQTTADVIVTGGHKAALGTLGIGLLWAKEDVEFVCPGAACEIGESSCGTFPSFCDVGSVNLPAAAALSEGLAWTKAQGRAAIAARLHAFATQLRATVDSHEKLQLLGPAEISVTYPGALPTVSFSSDTLALPALTSRLAEQGLLVRAGSHCAPQALSTLGHPEGCVRVSFGPMNTESDLRALLSALETL